jgi:nucleoside-diphosphate-sugar epimerase
MAHLHHNSNGDENGRAENSMVLGATGGIGGEVARRLHAEGWSIRALNRKPDQSGNAAFEWIAGDAMDREDVSSTATGVSLIVHAVNPPGYRKWNERVLPMIDNTIAAAKENGARILLPGTVYNYGPDTFDRLDETAPQNPQTQKGRIRVELESRLEAASRAGARVLIVRAGDFFGPKAENSWFAQGLVKPGRPLKAITYPGASGVGHQWAYLPDVAETMVQLVNRESELGAFVRFHMDGHWDSDGLRMVSAIKRAAGKPDLPVKSLPWTIMRLASPFVPLFRELMEMRYLWQTPVRLRNDRLVAFLGHEPRTPLDEAVRKTLAGLGCLEGRNRSDEGLASVTGLLA